MKRMLHILMVIIAIAFLSCGSGCAARLSSETVSDEIQSLPGYYELSLADEEDVLSVWNDYQALSAKEKEQVRSLITLEDLITRLDELKVASATPVITRIARLPAIVTLSDETVIRAARAAYEALTEIGKSHVTNLDLLVAKEDALQAAQDASANAEPVNDALKALPELADFTASSFPQVLAVRAAYEALAADEQAYVSRDLLKRLASLEAERGLMLPALAVSRLIAALPDYDQATLSDASAIAEARQALQALSASSRVYITEEEEEKVALLTAQMAFYQALDEQVKNGAARIDEAILSLEAAGITLESGPRLAEIRSSYDQASTDVQHAVTELHVLETLEAQYEALSLMSAEENARLTNALALIEALPQALTLDDRNQVLAAQEAYLALSEPSRYCVTNADKLEQALSTLSLLAEADVIDSAIASLPSDLTLASAERVNDVNALYQEAIADVKAYVTRLTELETALDTIARLEDPVGHALQAALSSCTGLFLTTSGALPAKSEGYTLSWSYAPGSNGSYYDVVKNKTLRATPLVFLSTCLFAAIDDRSIEIVVNIGLLATAAERIIFSTGGLAPLDETLSVADGGGSQAQQASSVGFGGLAVTVGDKVYLAGAKSVIDLHASDVETTGAVKLASLTPQGNVLDADGNVLYDAGAGKDGALAYEGSWFIYRNLSQRTITLNPGYLYGRNEASWAGFTRVIITPTTGTSYVVTRVLPDWGTDQAPLGVTWNDAVGTTITLAPGEAIICSHSYDADATYGDLFCANVGVLAFGVELSLQSYRLS